MKATAQDYNSGLGNLLCRLTVGKLFVLKMAMFHKLNRVVGYTFHIVTLSERRKNVLTLFSKANTVIWVHNRTASQWDLMGHEGNLGSLFSCCATGASEIALLLPPLHPEESPP